MMQFSKQWRNHISHTYIWLLQGITILLKYTLLEYIVIGIIVCTTQSYQINVHIGHYFASKIKVVPNDVRRVIIYIFEKQLKQIADVDNACCITWSRKHTMTVWNTCYIRQIHILEPIEEVWLLELSSNDLLNFSYGYIRSFL